MFVSCPNAEMKSAKPRDSLRVSSSETLLQQTLIAAAKIKEWTIEKLKSDRTASLGIGKTDDQENNGPARATRRNETADKIDFSDCD